MKLWRVFFFLIILWGVGFFVSTKRFAYPNKGTIFDDQRWSIWVGISWITILVLVPPLPMWLPFKKPIPWLIYILAEIFFFSILLFYYKLVNQSYTTLGFTLNGSIFPLIFGAKVFVGYFFSQKGLLYLLLLVTKEEISQERFLSVNQKSIVVNFMLRIMGDFEKGWGTWSLLIPILFSVIFKPILEELLYRGLLYGPIRKKLGPAMGMLITSILFMFSHLELIPYFFVIGLLLAYLYERTGSLLPGILFHATLNLLSVVSVVSYFNRDFPLSVGDLKTRTGWITIFLGTLFIAIEVVYYLMAKKGYTLRSAYLQKSPEIEQTGSL